MYIKTVNKQMQINQWTQFTQKKSVSRMTVGEKEVDNILAFTPFWNLL